MDMKELNYIVTIADAGSISAAAEKLFMAQSSLSQALSLYESELGTPIFVRTSRGVRPTPSGSVFISHARQILNHYRLAQSEVWDIEGLNGGRVEFGISSFRGTYLLPPALKQFHASYPQIQVEITELDSWDLEDRILKGLLDIALIAAPSEKIRHSCDFLMKDEIVLAASVNHPVMAFAHPCGQHSGEYWIDLKDTKDFTYILGSPGTVLGKMLRRELLKAGVEPAAASSQVSTPMAAAMARAGLGLAATYRSCIPAHESAQYLKIGRKGVFLDLALIYPSGGYRSKAAAALGEVLRQTYLGLERETRQIYD